MEVALSPLQSHPVYAFLMRATISILSGARLLSTVPFIVHICQTLRH